jgi:hypothetical protein
LEVSQQQVVIALTFRGKAKMIKKSKEGKSIMQGTLPEGRGFVQLTSSLR